ncbi:DUF488 domain-containing protein [Leifsonia sp. C5G2]|uniref:DUF488 domain-containing protein n=1 Tax=Leifsonia sp. C5G2 TaxID=2735269 RepID=UPI001584B3AD|nr:DUF488 domain-containing protein [Leifsonia sp. C5G2]NUU06095.1 DUF488 domain-containing protein [Leifsonia sp. C5G2]
MPTVFTIGHSTRGFDEVVGMLRVNGVTLLADIRHFPSSRRLPQWNRDAIEAALPPDIGYRWLERLGGRRHTPAGVQGPNGYWRVAAFRAYADYMATPPFAEGLDELLALAQTSRPAIMCSEAVPWRCHRRLVTDALLVRGVEVFDILSETSVRPAVLTPAARMVDGHLVYPPEGAAAAALPSRDG